MAPSALTEGEMSTADSAAFDALMAKVAELGRVCERLSQENAELRAQVSGLRAVSEIGRASCRERV